VDDSINLLRSVSTALLVARQRSFRGAMRSSRSGFRTLQRQIEALEARLGCLLFHRTGDGLVPTAEGHKVLAEAKRIEQVVADILRIGQSLNHEGGGEVVLAATEGLGTFWVSPQLPAFNRLHPHITPRLQSSMSLVDMREYGVDLALQVIEPVQPEIKRLKLGRLHMVLAASPGYVEKHGRPNTPAELSEHTFLFHSHPQWTDRRMIEEAVGGQLGQKQIVVMRSSAAHYMALEQGSGIGFIPSYAFGIGARLIHINLPIRTSIDIWLCFHEASRNIPRVAAVIDWISSIFDPRQFPWFRREFVSPAQFETIVDAAGAREAVRLISASRGS
jgi:DNA-binding transcriptional LysR family regulator